uniref:Putative secreted salivary protein n=1 Tax=Ixodes scapularis TaxID=6945 RepID=Q4PMS2_IXOSC|nr:putative secreted salivary protein [Ixodes scapularis]
MKATIAVLCFLVAVAYAIVVEARMGNRIDGDALNPLCEKPPSNCFGDAVTVYVYNRTGGCHPVGLNEECSGYGYYMTPDDCHKKCLLPPGTQGVRRI